ncbi:MAG: nuclear transport factor 2 family protein [Solirubrobacteraceae bacterium]
MNVQEWVDGYGQAWRELDADAAAALFTEDAVYRDQPFQSPYVGLAGVREYWTNVTSTQSDVTVRMGDPVVSTDRRRAAVEWWVTMKNSGEPISLTGILVLRFAGDGRCEELREAWHIQPEYSEPPAGWGR